MNLKHKRNENYIEAHYYRITEKILKAEEKWHIKFGGTKIIMTADFAPEKNVSKPQDRGATYLKNWKGEKKL